MKQLRTQRRRLFFDLESSPNIGLFWDAGYKKNIDYSNIIKERAIICICWKWEDDKEIQFAHWDKNQNDKSLLEKFIKIANEADELIGHNGDRFDLPWIRTRCLYHRIPVFPNYTTLDTLKNARSKFNFNSNKLDYIAKFLGVGEKIHTGYDLWKNIVLNKLFNQDHSRETFFNKESVFDVEIGNTFEGGTVDIYSSEEIKLETGVDSDLVIKTDGSIVILSEDINIPEANPIPLFF